MKKTPEAKGLATKRRGPKSKRSRQPGRDIYMKPESDPVNTVTLSEPRIGVRLRHARLTKGLSMRELASLAGCSESFVSKIENDRVRPSLAMLHRLVAVLETNVGALFTESCQDQDPVIVLRSEERPVIRVDPLRHGDGIALERLIPSARGALLQANIHVVAPGGSTDGTIHHEGEEVGYVLEGDIELVVDGTVHHLTTGTSFFFPSNLPHGYRNPGSTTARILWINSPPSF